MNQDPHLLDDYIRHILAAIERIQRYCADSNELAFLENDMLQDAVIGNFEVIGEASKNADRKFPDFLKQHPSLPFRITLEILVI